MALPARLLVSGAALLLVGDLQGRAATDGAASLSSAGKTDYAVYCSPCHGKTGNGDGPMARLLTVKPTRHNDADRVRNVSDDYLFRIIRDGGSAVGRSNSMAAWRGILSDERIAGLVAYIREMSGK